MNPRKGQYGLGHSLDGWVHLTNLTKRQTSLLRWAYAGLNPMVYGRYGVRQWAAPLPWTRLVVKDPFALLSLTAIVNTTGALPVIVFRHPGAVLSSVRRMGWSPDPSELERLESISPSEVCDRSTDELHMVARMWGVQNRIALDDLAMLDHGIVVSHEALAAGGERSLDILRDACGLRHPVRREKPQPVAKRPGDVDPQRLHNLNRDPKKVATAWRDDLDEGELRELEQLTGSLIERLQSQALPLPDE